MRGRGIRIDPEDLQFIEKGTILHWEFSHFVVFDSVSKEGVHILDPASGPRLVPWVAFSRSFTGVAIDLAPSHRFARVKIQGKGHIKALFKEVFAEKAEVRRVVLLSILMRVFGLATPLLTAMIVDRVVPRDDTSLLLVVVLGLGAIVGFSALSNLVRTHLLLRLRVKLDSRMTISFLEHMVSLPLGFFQRRSAGDLIMRVRSNAMLRETVTSQTFSAILDGLFAIIYLALILWLSPLLGLVAFGLGVLNAMMFFATKSKNTNLMSASLDSQAKTQHEMVQILEGIETLKCAGAEQRTVQNWSNLYADELNIALQQGALGAAIDSLRSAVQGMAPVIILSLGATQVLSGSISLGTMLALNALAMGVFGPVSALLSSAISVQMLRSYLVRVADVLNTDPEQDQRKVSAAAPLRGHVTVKNVSFKFSPKGPPVLNKINLDILPGTTVALVGESGSGKSTLAKLLVGMHKPQAGQIFFDGKSINELDIHSIRRQVGIVPQHPYLFGGSIRANIALSDPDASMDRVEFAARIAGIDQDIQAMPMGYNTPVTAGGSSLSGGQRQRLAIARAVLISPAILMMDEATSALDSITEQRVVHNLDQIGCTRVIIAHRLSTIVNADLIVVMHKGNIVEAGNHASLIAQGGYYAHLVRGQQGRGPRPKQLMGAGQ